MNRKHYSRTPLVIFALLNLVMFLFVFPNYTCDFTVIMDKGSTTDNMSFQIFDKQNNCYLIAENGTGYKVTGTTHSQAQATSFKLDAGKLVISNIDNGWYVITNAAKCRIKGHDWFKVGNASTVQLTVKPSTYVDFTFIWTLIWTLIVTILIAITPIRWLKTNPFEIDFPYELVASSLAVISVASVCLYYNSFESSNLLLSLLMMIIR